MLDGVEARAARRQEEKMRASRLDQLLCTGAFVAREIVEDDDVAWLEHWYELRFDPGLETCPFVGTIEHPKVHQCGRIGRPATWT